MERDRWSKTISIVALVMAVVGLSLGFAAFSNVLIINSQANVKPDSNAFNVEFYSTSSLDNKDLLVTGVSSTQGVAAVARIDEGRKLITGIHAEFTAPGQSVTYEVYAHNVGEYIAYLRSIIFDNVEGYGASKVCVPSSPGSTVESVDAACRGISVTVNASEVFTDISYTGITDHSVPRGGYEKIIVTISYDTFAETASGPFDVLFGDIYLEYGTNYD